MPSAKPFWIAPGSGGKRFPDRLVQAGYRLKNRILRFTAYLLRDGSRAPELVENAIQDLVDRKTPEEIERHPNPGSLLYGRVRALAIREKRQDDKLVFYSASDFDDRFGSSGDDDLVDHIDTGRIVSDLEARLKPAEKEFLKLLLMDYDIPEIARALGISQNAAYKRNSKLIAKARRLLARRSGSIGA